MRFLSKLFALLALFCGALYGQGTQPSVATFLGGPISATSAACATPQSCVWMKLLPDQATAAITISGTFSQTLVAESSADGGVTFSTLATYTTVQTNVVLNVSGSTDFRVRASAFVSGIANVAISSSKASSGVSAGTAATTVTIQNTAGASDPCLNPSILKSSVPINISAAATANLVSAVAAKSIYVCGFAFTISQVATTANTLQFLYSSTSGCGSGTTALTGLFGAGGVTAAAPIVVTGTTDGTEFIAPTNTFLCTTTAIGASGSFQGVLTYVQQ